MRDDRPSFDDVPPHVIYGRDWDGCRRHPPSGLPVLIAFIVVGGPILLAFLIGGFKVFFLGD